MILQKAMGWVWCCISAIPVTWEANTRRSRFKAYPDKKLARLCFKNKSSLVAYSCNSIYLGMEGRRIMV
jgi:hypothetical protein